MRFCYKLRMNRHNMVRQKEHRRLSAWAFQPSKLDEVTGFGEPVSSINIGLSAALQCSSVQKEQSRITIHFVHSRRSALKKCSKSALPAPLERERERDWTLKSYFLLLSFFNFVAIFFSFLFFITFYYSSEIGNNQTIVLQTIETVLIDGIVSSATIEKYWIVKKKRFLSI